MDSNLTAFLDRAHTLFSKRHDLYPIESIWLLVLGVFAIANVLVMAWSFVLFIGTSDDDVFIVTPRASGTIETLNRAELDELLETLRVRQAAFETRTGSARELPPPEEPAAPAEEDTAGGES